MIVPQVPTEEIADEEGHRTKAWDNFFQQQFSNMQECLSDEGFRIPSVSSDPASVTPSTTGGQLAQVAASFGTQGGVNAGTVIFDPYEINGGAVGPPQVRLGQLKVILNDGIFHSITNT